MPKHNFFSFFRPFSFSLNEFFGKKPEPDSPYTKTRDILIDMIEHYCGKRFAKKIVKEIPSEIIEKLTDEKIGKLEEKLMLKIGVASKKVMLEFASMITEYHQTGIGIGYIPLFYYSVLHKQVVKNAVREVFSKKSLEGLINS